MKIAALVLAALIIVGQACQANETFRGIEKPVTELHHNVPANIAVKPLNENSLPKILVFRDALPKENSASLPALKNKGLAAKIRAKTAENGKIKTANALKNALRYANLEETEMLAPGIIRAKISEKSEKILLGKGILESVQPDMNRIRITLDTSVPGIGANNW